MKKDSPVIAKKGSTLEIKKEYRPVAQPSVSPVKNYSRAASPERVILKASPALVPIGPPGLTKQAINVTRTPLTQPSPVLSVNAPQSNLDMRFGTLDIGHEEPAPDSFAQNAMPHTQSAFGHPGDFQNVYQSEPQSRQYYEQPAAPTASSISAQPAAGSSALGQQTHQQQAQQQMMNQQHMQSQHMQYNNYYGQQQQGYYPQQHYQGYGQQQQQQQQQPQFKAMYPYGNPQQSQQSTSQTAQSTSLTSPTNNSQQKQLQYPYQNSAGSNFYEESHRDYKNTGYGQMNYQNFAISANQSQQPSVKSNTTPQGSASSASTSANRQIPAQGQRTGSFESKYLPTAASSAPPSQMGYQQMGYAMPPYGYQMMPQFQQGQSQQQQYYGNPQGLQQQSVRQQPGQQQQASGQQNANGQQHSSQDQYWGEN